MYELGRRLRLSWGKVQGVDREVRSRVFVCKSVALNDRKVERGGRCCLEKQERMMIPFENIIR